MASLRLFRVLEPDYPWRLRELEQPPDTLWLRGELGASPAVAIVGTRDPSPEAEAYAFSLAERLGSAGVSVWSGGARGIDAAAHEGALEAGAQTVVVMGTGSDGCFPSEHDRLFERIASSEGGLLYPFPPEQPPMPWTFLRRNGVLAALVDAMVIVQAPLRSGARSAAAWARRLGRPLFVVPGWPWDSRAVGNTEEIRLGATVLTGEDRLAHALGISLAPRPSAALPAPGEKARREPTKAVSDGPRALRFEEVAAPETTDRSAGGGVGADEGGLTTPLSNGPLSFACHAVVDATGATPRHFDVLCETTGLAASLLQEALLTLTLHAVLVEGPSGFYRRINH